MTWPKYADDADYVEYAEYTEYADYADYPDCANQTFQAKTAQPNLPNQIKRSLLRILNQAYQTKITGQSSQHLGP